MDKKLLEIYNNMGTSNEVINESNPPDNKVGKQRAGDGFEGADKNAKPITKGIDTPDNKVKKPVEGPSQGSDTVEAGKGKPLSKKIKESDEHKPIFTSFEDLYQKTLKEDLDTEETNTDEVVPAKDLESADFSDETGDFGGDEDDLGDEAEEEVDVATELRLVADRLADIAQRLSGGNEMDEDLGIEDNTLGDDEIDTNLDDEIDAGLAKESHAPHQLKKASKSKLGPKMSQKASGSIRTKTGLAKTPSTSKDVSGKLSPVPQSKFGPKMSQKVDGSGPAVNAGNEKFIG